MSLVITEEQQMLKSSAAELMKSKGTIAHLRQLRDDRSELGYDANLWQEMVEMGWTALTIPEAYGGLDFGYTGLGQVLEETGRTLCASPLVSSVLLGATAINLGGNEDQKQNLLSAISEGSLLVALAHEESNHHQPNTVKTKAESSGDNFIINGHKTMVLDGHTAQKLIVVARTEGNENDPNGIALFIVDADADGVQIERKIMMDSRNSANISFTNVTVPKDALLGNYSSGQALLEKTLNIGQIGLAAEMLGSVQEAFDRTIAYLKEREQFGVKIGTFQALQHRAADMFSEIELCKSIVIKALQAIDEDNDDLSQLASLAKAKLGLTFQLVSNEGVQMFGGIGMTDDEEIGFFLKRARVVQQTLGDSNYHLDRWAARRGY